MKNTLEEMIKLDDIQHTSTSEDSLFVNFEAGSVQRHHSSSDVGE